MVSPFELEPSEVDSIATSDGGALLHIIARRARPEKDPPCVGILIVAKRREPDRYAVVVWHLLYGWAFEYLGLDGAGPS